LKKNKEDEKAKLILASISQIENSLNILIESKFNNKKSKI